MEESKQTETILDKYGSENYQWTKNQHYVPQFYLKQFVNDNGKIEVVDKENKTIGSYNVKHICSGEYFYGIETGKKDKISQLMEDFFSEYENDFANNYTSIINTILDYNNKISDDIIYQISKFTAITYLRGIYFKEQFMRTTEEIDKFMIINNYRAKKEYDPNNPTIKEISSKEDFEKKILNGEFNIKHNNLQYYQFIFEKMNEFINMFFCQKKIFYISDGERNFITTDYCISEITPESHSIYGIPFMSKIHYFPLSPKILVIFYNPLKKGKENKRKMIGKRDVMYHNFLCGMEGKYIYSKSRNDLNEDEYSKARSINIEKLYELFPSQFSKDKMFKDEIMDEAKKLGKVPNKFYDNFCDDIIFKYKG